MGRVKIQDVARLAQVSLSTVSGVLNEKTNVRPETRQRVLDVIAQVGYSPNIFASNLARRRTKIIGIIVSDLLNPFFAEAAKALDIEAKRLGYETFLIASNFSEEQQYAGVRQMLAMRVAGVAMMTSENDPEAFALLKSSGTPAVYLDNNHVSSKIGTVRVDKRRGMFIAVEHLLQLGHRKILLVKNSQQVASDPPMLSHLERQLGFEDAVHRYNSQELDVHVIDEPGPSASAGFCAIEKSLRSHEFTAVVAINDLVALGVFRGLQAALLNIPGDISVVGFDNTYLCDFLHPPLTTVATPRAELASAVIDMLLASVEREEFPHERLLEARLMVRASTAPPRHSK
jgi:DNA-binding LacI/PurR family transcriptional regulator